MWRRVRATSSLFRPHFDHIEGNPYDEPAEAVLSRGPDNIVINLDE